MRPLLWLSLVITALLLIMLSAWLTLTRQAEADSAWLVYVSATDQQIYRVRVDGAGQQRLTGMPFAVHYLAWSPDGHRLAFDTGENEGSSVYHLRLNGRDLTPILPPNLGISTTRPLWSADGHSLFIIAIEKGMRNLLRVNGSGDPAPQPLTAFRIGGGIRLEDFGLAPDGQHLVIGLRNTHEERRNSLVIVPTGGGESVTLVGDAPGVYAPTWSPDGERILFYGTPGSGYGLYEIALDGSGLRRMSEIHQGVEAQYSPDGQWLLLRPIPASSLLMMSADGREIRPLTPAYDSVMTAKWSAGGGWVAFTTLSTNRQSALYRVRPDGGDLQQLATDVKVNSFDWSPIITRDWSAAGLAALGAIMGGLGGWFSRPKRHHHTLSQRS